MTSQCFTLIQRDATGFESQGLFGEDGKPDQGKEEVRTRFRMRKKRDCRRPLSSRGASGDIPVLRIYPQRTPLDLSVWLRWRRWRTGPGHGSGKTSMRKKRDCRKPCHTKDQEVSQYFVFIRGGQRSIGGYRIRSSSRWKTEPGCGRNEKGRHDKKILSERGRKDTL